MPCGCIYWCDPFGEIKALGMFKTYYSIICTSSKGLKLWVFTYCRNSGKSCFFGVKKPEKNPYFCYLCKCQYSFCARRSYMMKLKYVFNHIIEHLGWKGDGQYVHPHGTHLAWKIWKKPLFSPIFKRAVPFGCTYFWRASRPKRTKMSSLTYVCPLT